MLRITAGRKVLTNDDLIIGATRLISFTQSSRGRSACLVDASIGPHHRKEIMKGKFVLPASRLTDVAVGGVACST